MSFVAPLFLAGLLLIGLPFWLHRLQAQSSERKPFSSAMLLESAEQRVYVRKKLKYLLLLALRVILLALLAFAFAGPFISLPPTSIESTDAGTHLVVVDSSASMSRSGTFEQARNEAQRAIDAAPAGALLQVASASSDFELLGDVSADKAAARSALSNLVAGSARLDFGDAMAAVERLASTLPPPVTLHFVSDFQASAMPVRFADFVPANVAELVPRVVGTGEPFNWSVSYARLADDQIQYGLTGDGSRELLGDAELYLNDILVETQGIGQNGPQVMSFDLPALEEGEIVSSCASSPPTTLPATIAGSTCSTIRRRPRSRC